MKILGPIDTSEIKLIRFAFARELAPGEILVSCSVGVTDVAGTDFAAANIRQGNPTIDGTDVLQRVGNCKSGARYHLRAHATSDSGNTHVIGAVLPVVTLPVA